ncbi:MAG: 3-oxoacyl-ACP synthase, partial [Treponema sp.]|nr:3-oxoacyl-ACP synthase [Treponema sp.]
KSLDSCLVKAKSMYGVERIAVLVGGCDNGSELSLKAHRQYLETGSFPKDYKLDMQGASYVASYIKDLLKLEGPATAIATACSSSSTAMARAADMISGGICDAALVGGVDIVSDLELLGFASMECISPSPTNPFSINRMGITLGEAACFFIISRDKLLTGEPVVFLAGYGETSDAYHVTSPDPDASGAVQAMRQALDSAGIKAGQLDYVNLHGTGTHPGDAMEALAVSKALGCQIPCSASKSITGHTLGAAGAISAAICHEVLVRNRFPAQYWDGQYDSNIPRIKIVDASFSPTEKKTLHYCMSNSFGFGGVNVSLVFGKD